VAERALTSCPSLFLRDNEVERGIFRRQAAQYRSEALPRLWFSKGPQPFGGFSLRKLLKTISLFLAGKEKLLLA